MRGRQTDREGGAWAEQKRGPAAGGMATRPWRCALLLTCTQNITIDHNINTNRALGWHLLAEGERAAMDAKQWESHGAELAAEADAKAAELEAAKASVDKELAEAEEALSKAEAAESDLRAKAADAEAAVAAREQELAEAQRALEARGAELEKAAKTAEERDAKVRALRCVLCCAVLCCIYA